VAGMSPEMDTPLPMGFRWHESEGREVFRFGAMPLGGVVEMGGWSPVGFIPEQGIVRT
jgi:membrane-associated protease RseP (regulator of RpoE activity)